MRLVPCLVSSYVEARGVPVPRRRCRTYSFGSRASPRVSFARSGERLPAGPGPRSAAFGSLWCRKPDRRRQLEPQDTDRA